MHCKAENAGVNRKWQRVCINKHFWIFLYSNVRNGTCYTSSECTNKGGTASGNCAAGLVKENHSFRFLKEKISFQCNSIYKFNLYVTLFWHFSDPQSPFVTYPTHYFPILIHTLKHDISYPIALKSEFFIYKK